MMIASRLIYVRRLFYAFVKRVERDRVKRNHQREPSGTSVNCAGSNF